MVTSPGDYPWSSFHANALGQTEARVHPHDAYLQLGTTEPERRDAYRHFLAAGIAPEDDVAIGVHTRQQKPWGSHRFKRQIACLTQRATDVRPRGRPQGSGAK